MVFIPADGSHLLCKKMEPKYLCRVIFLRFAFHFQPLLSCGRQYGHGSIKEAVMVFARPQLCRTGCPGLEGSALPQTCAWIHIHGGYTVGIHPLCALDTHPALMPIQILLKTLAFCSQRLWLSVRKLS